MIAVNFDYPTARAIAHHAPDCPFRLKEKRREIELVNPRQILDFRFAPKKGLAGLWCYVDDLETAKQALNLLKKRYTRFANTEITNCQHEK